MTKAVFNLFMKGLNQITELMEKEDMTENTEKQKLNECNQKHELRMKKYRKRVFAQDREYKAIIKGLENNLAKALERLEEVTVKWVRFKGKITEMVGKEGVDGIPQLLLALMEKIERE